MKIAGPGTANNAVTLGVTKEYRRVFFEHESRMFKAVYAGLQRLLFIIAKLLFWAFADLKIQGLENVRGIGKGPLIIIANHKSFLDPLIIGLCFPFFSKVLPLRFMAKDVLMKNFQRRLLFRSLGCYPALKGQGLEISLRTPSEILRAGGAVIFFPEGIRVRGDGLGEPRPGAAQLASCFSDVPILPIAIAGTHKAGRFGLLYSWPKLKVWAKIGEPFRYKDKAPGREPEAGIKILMGEIEKSYAEISQHI